MTREETRRPRHIYDVGTDPDPRFSLANERTALAWMRTALAIVAGGVTLLSLAAIPDLPGWTAGLGLVACLTGAVLAVLALRGWRRTERALRLGEPLPSPGALIPLSVAIGVLAVAAVVVGLMELSGGG